MLHRNKAKTMPQTLNTAEDRQDRETILFKGSKAEDQHTSSIR